MTKKHFIAIAQIIKSFNSGGIMTKRYGIENAFADWLQKQNKLFDRQKFLIACGVEKEKPNLLVASVEAYNAGYGKEKRRVHYCDKANEWVEQEKQEDGEWFCLHDKE